MYGRDKKMILNLLLKRIQFIKYVISGTVNTAITLIVYNVLIKFYINYMAANFIGYFIGALNGFVLNRKWVFKSDGKISTAFIKFVCVNLMSLIFSSLVLFFLVNNLYFNKVAAQLIATIVTGLFNYTLNRLWTFS